MNAARRSLAALLVAMAAGQLSDLGGFVDVLAAYEALPGPAVAPAALAVVVAELVAGVGLLAGGWWRGWAARVAVTVSAAWAALGAQAFVRGLALENCGCFGVHLPQSLWWGVLVQDAAFVATAVWVAGATRAAAGGRPAGSGPPRSPIPARSRG